MFVHTKKTPPNLNSNRLMKSYCLNRWIYYKKVFIYNVIRMTHSFEYILSTDSRAHVSVKGFTSTCVCQQIHEHMCLSTDSRAHVSVNRFTSTCVCQQIHEHMCLSTDSRAHVSVNRFTSTCVCQQIHEHMCSSQFLVGMFLVGMFAHLFSFLFLFLCFFIFFFSLFFFFFCLTGLRAVSCLSNVSSVSGLSILDCLFGFVQRLFINI